MFGNAAPTPYDLEFRAFGIPVRVHPIFWLCAALLSQFDPGDLQLSLIRTAAVFISVLVHELGHALTARHYGSHPEIVLYAFGGYASYATAARRSTLQNVTVTFAGPAAGLLLFCIASVLDRVIPDPGYVLSATLDWFKWINLIWSLFNLLPIYPLDGGQITREILRWWNPWNGVAVSLVISLVAGGVAAYYLFQTGQTMAAVMLAALAFDNFQALQSRHF